MEEMPMPSSDPISLYFHSQRASINDDPSGQLVAFIDGTHKTLDCAIYDLKQPAVLKALKAAVDRGVKVHIAYDGGRTKSVAGGPQLDPKPAGTAAAIEEAGLGGVAIPVHVRGSHLMHSKYAIRDGTTLWTGSGNWTHGGLDLQDNNYLEISSAELCRAYQENFGELLKEHAADHQPLSTSAKESMSLRPATGIPIGHATLTPYFSGGGTEQIETYVTERLKTVKKVRVMAMLISDPGILQSLSDLHKAHADIRGVLDPHEMAQVMFPPKGPSHTPPEQFWFTQPGKGFVAAPSHAFIKSGDKNDFMHNKVLIIDDEVVVTGSYNLSESAESNDENTLVIESKAIATKYTEYFDKLFAQYTKHGHPLPLTAKDRGGSE
jgi:phosphatidylserine/phosphatidylglycerophosphate/cardiolipin synthase-like enzyme